MTSAHLTVNIMMWDKLKALVLATLLGTGMERSAGATTELTVAPWYKAMQDRAEGSTPVPKGGKLSIRRAFVSFGYEANNGRSVGDLA